MSYKYTPCPVQRIFLQKTQTSNASTAPEYVVICRGIPVCLPLYLPLMALTPARGNQKNSIP